MFTNINLLAVVAAAIAVMAVGALWYTPFLFGKSWMRAMKKKPEDLTDAGKAMATAAFANLIMTFFLAWVIKLSGDMTFGSGMLTGFWLWLGFVATSHLVITVYENRAMPLFNIFVSQMLVAMMIAGGILAVWP